MCPQAQDGDAAAADAKGKDAKGKDAKGKPPAKGKGAKDAANDDAELAAARAESKSTHAAGTTADVEVKAVGSTNGEGGVSSASAASSGKGKRTHEDEEKPTSEKAAKREAPPPVGVLSRTPTQGVLTRSPSSSIYTKMDTTTKTRLEDVCDSAVELSTGASAVPNVGAAPPRSARDAWAIHKTDSGDTYFFNDSTGESAWVLPEGAQVRQVCRTERL